MTSIIERITNFFQYIADLISNFKNIFTSIGNLLHNVLMYLSTLLSIFPGWIYGVLIAIVVVCIVYKILGREGAS